MPRGADTAALAENPKAADVIRDTPRPEEVENYESVKNCDLASDSPSL